MAADVCSLDGLHEHKGGGCTGDGLAWGESLQDYLDLEEGL